MAAGNLIDGRAIAAQLQGELIQRIAALKRADGRIADPVGRIPPWD